MEIVGNDKLVVGVCGQRRSGGGRSGCSDDRTSVGVDVRGGDAFVGRVRTEVIERGDANDDARERSGNLRVLHVGDVLCAIDVESVNLGFEGCGDLGRGAGEVDHEAAFRDVVDLKALAGEPAGDRFDVGRVGAVLLAELIGGEPVMEVGAAGLILRFDEAGESGFAVGGAIELQEHVLHRHTVADFAAVVLRVRFAANVSGERDHVGIVDRGRHQSLCGGCCLGLRERREEKGWRGKTDAAGSCAEKTVTLHEASGRFDCSLISLGVLQERQCKSLRSSLRVVTRWWMNPRG